MPRLPSLDGDNDEKRDSDKGKKDSLPKKNSPGLPSMDDMPPLDFEDEFESLPADRSEKQEDDRDLNESIYEEVDKIDNPSSELPEAEKEDDDDDDDDTYADEDNYYPEYEDDIEEEEVSKEKFIDRVKKRIIPFGGKKSKKKISKRFVKSSDFDDRKNKLAKTKMIQFGIILAIVLMFFLGLKNTFLPSHVYTGDQIRNFAAEGAGKTGFPSERGQAYVESFVESYLTIDRTKPELMQSLSYFYGEEGLTNVDFERLNMQWGSDVKQHIIIPPRVFEVELINEYSAQYKVSTFVSSTEGKVVEGEEPVGRWLSFSVNVYNDEETDSLAITPDSPSIIPAYRIAEETSVPERAPFGNGTINEEIVPAVSPTINGFIVAYANSSVESHEAVLQYIDDKDDIDLYDGFNGAVEVEGDPSSSISKVVYNNEDGSFSADLTVNWVDISTLNEDIQVKYTSRYMMEIKPTEDGKYTVSSFKPYTYEK